MKIGRYIMEQKKFVQCEIDGNNFPKLIKIEENGRRFYRTEESPLLPSVTTVLDFHKSDGLKEWEARVGPDKAEKEREAAAWRGTILHKCMDLYVNNAELPVLSPHTKLFFDQVKGIADKHIDVIRANELPIHSISYGTAGTCDLIADYDGRLSVIDFKTSKNEKKEEWIKNYFEQASMYAAIFNQSGYARCSGSIIEQIVIIIAVEHGGVPQVFVKPGIKEINRHVFDFQAKLYSFITRK